MKNIVLPDTGTRRLPFYLSMEEWVAASLPADRYFFSWRVRPTVICGRHQDMAKEVDMDYCRSRGIDVVRRRSGGGCVYADMDNFMFSYIVPGNEICTTFAEYTTAVASMLRSLGLNASANGRNDIMIGRCKVSGNAFYHLPGRCIAHGTMLYRYDPEVLSRALTPSRAKLESKGVQSVQSRVSCLVDEGLAMSPAEFEKYAVDYMCDSRYVLTADDISEIEAIEQNYYRPEFLHGRHALRENSPDKTVIRRHRRIEGAGEFDAAIKLGANNTIEAVDLSGDFFLLGNPAKEIFSALQGITYERDAIRQALGGTNVATVISGLSTESLLNILTD